MQQILRILSALAILSAVILLLRSRWHTLRLRTRRCIIAAAVAAIALFLGGYAIHWTTASDRANAAVCWAAVAGYLLLLAVHSLTRPRWITAATAVLLALPILGSSLFLPLGSIFNPYPRRIVALGNNLYVSWQSFAEQGHSVAGTDIEVYDQPPFLPFLQHGRLGGRFYNRRCNAAATEITLQPDHKSVFVRCPPWPNELDPSPGELVRLH